MENINIAETLVRLIKKTQPTVGKKGKLFRVTFVKKDGTLRTMRARLGMSSKVTGKGLSFEPEAKGLMPVWSADSQGFRMLNVATITELQLPDGSGHLATVYSRVPAR